MDAGRILNPLTGKNQIQGAVVMGIGMALFEETTYDPQNGAPINSNLADYMVTVNADATPIDVHFLDYPDKEINELGARASARSDSPELPPPSPKQFTTQPGCVRELPVKIEDLL
jgi:xanthine dehydrogenase YagR molybdenum-binding subunit